MVHISGIGDIDLKTLLKEGFGFEHDFLPVVAVVHIAWILLFLFVFAYGIKFLNFQRRWRENLNRKSLNLYRIVLKVYEFM